MESSNSRFWFLRKNTLFRKTGLSGWPYIFEARRMTEVMFWYLVITFLALMTIFNVYNTIAFYNTEPTNTYVLAVASTDNLSIENFTLTLSLSMLEFSRRSLLNTKTVNERFLSSNTDVVTEHYLCKVFNPDDSYLNTDIWNEMIDKQWKHTNTSSTENNIKLATIGGSEIIVNWTKTMTVQREKFDNFMRYYKQIQMPTDKYDLEFLDEEFLALQDEILQTRPDQLAFWLMQLEQFQTGVDWRRKISPFLNASEQPQITYQSGEQLLSDVLAELSKIVHIEANRPAEVYLSGWTYDGNTQHFTFQVVPSQRMPGTLEMRIYSFLYSWCAKQVNVIQAYTPLITDPQNPEFSNTCGGPLYDPLTLVKEHYRKYAQLTLDTHRGNGIRMLPIQFYDINILPTNTFLSETVSCYPGSFETCLASCSSRLHIEKCSCYPWNLYFLNLDSKHDICNSPCTQVVQKECQTLCEQALRRPCNLAFYSTEYTSTDVGRLAGGENLDALFAFNISKPAAFHHATFIERYLYTRSSFLSEIGGLVEFWLGANLIGFIHLGAYLIRQCYNATQPNTKTRRTLAALCGSEQIFKNTDYEDENRPVSSNEFEKRFRQERKIMLKEIARLERKLEMAGRRKY